MSEKSFKITVCFERRADGGLRVWSEDVPGLVLSHRNVDDVLEDVPIVIKEILSERLCMEVEVRPLQNLRQHLESNGIVDKVILSAGPHEYVATCH